MKLKYYLKFLKVYKKIKNYLFKKTFHYYLYFEILNKLSNGEKHIRYYMNTVDKYYSLKKELNSYHDKYNTTYDELYYVDIYLYTETYLRSKFNIYKDIKFEYNTDENGLYFEIKLL